MTILLPSFLGLISSSDEDSEPYYDAERVGKLMSPVPVSKGNGIDDDDDDFDFYS